MLIEFTVKNFRSFQEEAIFSMLPEKKIKDSKNSIIETGLEQVPELHNVAVIYGANASGKSTLLDSIHVMRHIVLHSAKDTIKNQKLPYRPFRLSATSLKEPTLFSIQFIAQGVRYHYGFAYNEERIIEEFLDAYPKGYKQGWFERKWKDTKYEYNFSPLFSGKKESIRHDTRENTLFLSKAVDNDNKNLEPVWDWFRELSVNNRGSREKTSKLCTTDEGKAKVLEFLLDADIPSIKAITAGYKEINLDIQSDDDEPAESRELKGVLKRLIEITNNNKDINRIPEIKFMRKAKDSEDLIPFDLNDDESEGTKKLFDLVALWINASEKQVPFLYDELDTKLHPNLQKFLVNKFVSTKGSKAQLIFTSHNTNFMKDRTLRRDQFWFTEFKLDKGTDLYPLTAVKEKASSPRKGEALERGYLEGRYGATPYLPLED
ncbi:MAG: hypothetical protein COV35_06865 [Alphaproteobacteria bacterium CG11_big_fil_rev_8_21_14_0_20_39_49]|nr:MAG: hypothetical protein COV35_06865 [Alphaproteobacteria bacterium CG11_big_fil_rev_8_21_14_0_20_39_49]